MYLLDNASTLGQDAFVSVLLGAIGWVMINVLNARGKQDKLSNEL
jgi:hypothetical protein